jgi:hypothetical protein
MKTNPLIKCAGNQQAAARQRRPIFLRPHERKAGRLYVRCEAEFAAT